jgi:hypothetical protein
MTFADIRTEVWEALKKPTDLDPSVDATRLNRVINEAQTKLAAWRDPDTGRIFRYNGLYNSLNYRSTTLTDTISAVSNTNTPCYIDLDGDNLGTGDDRYNDWILEITSGDADGEVRVITDYDSDNTRLYYNEAFSSDPEADDTIKIYKRFDRLLPSTHAWVGEHISLPATTDRWRADGNLVQVLNIYDITNDRLLNRAGRTDWFVGTQAGDPREWYQRGNTIFYDLNQDTDDVDMRLEYYRNPIAMSADSDEPELPTQYHRAIITQALVWFLTRLGELDDKWKLQADLKQHMREVVSQWDIRDERVDNALEMQYD